MQSSTLDEGYMQSNQESNPIRRTEASDSRIYIVEGGEESVVGVRVVEGTEQISAKYGYASRLQPCRREEPFMR